MNKLYLLILSLSSLCVNAQNQGDIECYFTQTFNNSNAVVAPSARVSVSRLNAKRALVWQAWCKANKAAAYHLPATDSLGSTTDKWLLPDTLEPHAVMPFYYGCKGSKPEAGYPLYVYLHGSGPKQQEWQTGLILAKRFTDAPSLYFIPQIPNEGEWYRWWQRSKQVAWSNLLREAMLSPDVNPNRLYVFGISEGGYGSQRLASFYADYWAAAGPMAGGEPLKNAPVENLENIGFSFRTGANDAGFYRNRLTGYTKEALDSMEALYPAGFRHKIELIPGRQHFIDYSVTTPWLSHFTRNPYPKHFIWEDFEMDGLHRTGFYNIKVNKRPATECRTRYDVNIAANEVNIVVEDVHYTTVERDPVYGIELKFARHYTPARGGSFTLYLDEHLVDLSQPVKVVVNGKTICERRLRLDVKNMVQSLATYFDPERIYPAAVEVVY